MIYEIALVAMVIAAKPKEPPVYQCVRWGWTGDIDNRKVVCYEWKEKDCAKRLYTNICKAGV